MVSTNLMRGLFFLYCLIALVSACEGNWARVLYWVSAAGITMAVLWMGK